MALTYHGSTRVHNLRHLVDIQHQLSAADELTGSPGVWGTFKQAWADVSQVTGREATVAFQQVPIGTYQVIVRHADGILPDMRVKYRGKYLYITAVINVEERDRWTVLYCTERVQ